MTAKGFTINNLIEAIRAGRLSGVINALEDGDDIEMPDMHGYGGLPLRTACFEGNLAIVRELLSHGANPNAVASDGPGAPLRLAFRKGHQHVVALLLKNGAVIPEGVAITPEVFDVPCAPLPGAALIPPPPESKPDNVIEFRPSSMPPPIAPHLADNADTLADFGTATHALSMDLLFLEEKEPPQPTGKR
jgi:ankyrin repeat protein